MSIFRWHKVYTEEEHRCPHEVGHNWKDISGRNLGDAVKVICADTHAGSTHDTKGHSPPVRHLRLFPNVYPMPIELAKLIEPGTSDPDGLARPSILEKADTNNFLKMLKFNIWANSKVNKNEFRTLSDVIKEEVKIFEQHGFEKRAEFQVNFFDEFIASCHQLGTCKDITIPMDDMLNGI